MTSGLISFSINIYNPDQFCSGRTIFVIIAGPAGPFMSNICGLAGPFMNLDQIFCYSAHTKVHEYPRFAPEVLKHSFSLEDPVLLSRYSSVVLTSKFSRLFLGWRLAYYWYRCFPYKRYLCQKQPSCKKGEAKNAQVHVHGVTKRHDIKSGQESIYVLCLCRPEPRSWLVLAVCSDSGRILKLMEIVFI